MKPKYTVFLVLIAAVTSLILASCSSQLSVDLAFAESIEITYVNRENENASIEITEEADVAAMKTIFSGTAIKSDTEPHMCMQGALTDLKFIGTSETFMITLDCHGTVVPQNFKGAIRIEPDDVEKFTYIVSKYITDMSAEQEWLQLNNYEE